MRRPCDPGSTGRVPSSTASSGPRGSTTTKPQPERPPSADDEGVYRSGATIVYSILGAYAFLALLMLVLIVPHQTSTYVWVPYLLLGLVVFLLARYLSTHYVVDDSYLRARRLLGGRTIRLEEVRRIEFASLRDLVPISGGLSMGLWGWRGRMYSPNIGEFDSVFTDAARGLLVTAGAFPLYLSPRHPVEFARELSRRVRSYTGPLDKDVGDPRQFAPPQ